MTLQPESRRLRAGRFDGRSREVLGRVAGDNHASRRRRPHGVEALESRLLFSEVLTNPSFSAGAQGWVLSGDFWAGTTLSSYRTGPGHAAGGVSATGVSKNNANGSISQQITIPPNATSADLQFWYSVATHEDTTTAEPDKLLVQLTGTASGTVLLEQFSNLEATIGYVQAPAFSLMPWRGQTVGLTFAATTNVSLPTTFRVDDVSVDITAPPPPPVPALASRPAAPAKLYLDFDGDSTPSWAGNSPGTTPPFDRDGNTTTFGATELDWIDEIWKRVSEKYSPFNLDVTTVNPGALGEKQAFRIVIGGDGMWYGTGTSGGIAQLGGFYDAAASNTGWVFAGPAKFGSAKDIAEAVSHESGHGFGLDHQKTVGSDYYSPTGPRAPVMGTSYYAERGLWWKTNEFPGQDSPQPVQDDLLVLSGTQNGFGYRDDDYATTFALAGSGIGSSAWRASGVIETLADSDAFSFSTTVLGNVAFDVGVATLGPTLDARIELRSGDGVTLLASAAPSNALAAALPVVRLVPGDYQVIVRGQGAYGDLGQYGLTGTLTPAQAPQVGSLGGSPYPVTSGNNLTLTATAVSDPDGSVVEVRFFRESNGVAGLQAGAGGDTPVGTDSSSVGGWLTTFSTSGLAAGAYTFYATAVDDDGMTSPAATATVTVDPPNQPPSTAVTTPSSPQTGSFAIGYQLLDAESNPCSILVEYSADGGSTWNPATAGAGGDGTTGQVSSAGGVTHTFVWNSAADLGQTLRSNVRVRITPSDSNSAGSPATSAAFTVDNLANHAPTNVGITPGSASDPIGPFRTFAAQYRDVEGAADIDIAYLRVLNTSTGKVLTALYYGPTNKLHLLADDGSTLLGGFTPGSANTITNTLGTLDVAGTSVTRSGATMTVNWAVSAKAPLAGSNSLQLLSRDHAVAWSPLTTNGSWSIAPLNSAPVNVGLTPTSASDSVGVFRTFTAQYRDAQGAADIDIAYLRVLNTSTGQVLTALYYGPTDKLYLVAEDGSTLLGGFVPGSANTISNTLATLDVANTTLSRVGDTLTVNWSLSPKATLAGSNSTQLLARDRSLAWSPLTTHGSWSVSDPANAAPVNAGLAPSTASDPAGTFRTFAAQYRDANGAADIDIAYLRVASASTGQVLTALYYAPTNRLYLLSETGALLGGYAPGSANTITNTLGTLDVAGTSVSRAGDTMTVNWKLSAKAPLAGSNTLQLMARDRSFAWSPLTAFGTWSIL